MGGGDGADLHLPVLAAPQYDGDAAAASNYKQTDFQSQKVELFRVFRMNETMQ